MHRLLEIASVFFKLGIIAFGGPAAHIAMMEDEIVSKRKWMDKQHFLDLMGATNLIPGPNSTEMTMHCGYVRGGVPGLIVAGFSFIFPAVTITLILALMYAKFGKLPEVQPFLYGIQAAVIALIVGAIIKLGKKAMKSYQLMVLAFVVLVLGLLGFNEIHLLLVSGVLGAVILYFLQEKRIDKQNGFGFVLATITSSPKLGIFLSFLKIGAILYGSGYVLFAYLDAEFVQQGIMNRKQLMDAVAVGQITPGPVLSTATFVGYQLGGIGGAVLATIGIFLPSFVFSIVLHPILDRLKKIVWFRYFLDAVNAAAVAIIAVVVVKMAGEIAGDWRGIIIAILATLYMLFAKQKNAVLVIVSGAFLGFLLSLV